MNSFSDLQLPATIGDALTRIGFKVPTPVQSKAIPVAMAGKDLIGCAQTGTGKTAAYCIPIFSRLLQGSNDIALVLVPTRELANQIEEFWLKLAQGQRSLGCASLIGGMPMKAQLRALSKKPRLVVATPGRLIDHLTSKTIDLSRLSVLVLDEADRMLDMGFEPQLARISRFVPVQRQTLLFSATLSAEAERLSTKFVKNPVRVTIGEISKAAEQIVQNVVSTEVARKSDTLLDQINLREKGTILVFARTQSRTDRVARYLTSFGLQVARIHGGRSQAQRNGALDAFKTGKVRILVATDIAARGIDVAGVASVINYDLPQMAEDYIHRIGRTGRAGASGEAVSLITSEDRAQWKQILNLLKKTGSAMPIVTSQESNAQEESKRVAPPKVAPTGAMQPQHSGGRSKHGRPHRNSQGGQPSGFGRPERDQGKWKGQRDGGSWHANGNSNGNSGRNGGNGNSKPHRSKKHRKIREAHSFSQ